MSLPALRWAIGARLRAHPQVVLLVLAYHHEPKTKACFPSIATIAAEAGIAPSSVKVALDRLEEYGLIRERPRSEKGARLSSQYDLFIGSRPNAKAEADAPKKRFHLAKGEPESGQPCEPESGQGGEPVRYGRGEPESGQGGVSRSPATIGETYLGGQKGLAKREVFDGVLSIEALRQARRAG